MSEAKQSDSTAELGNSTPFIWNCWTRNYSARDMGVITHAFDESSAQYQQHERALCGVQINDTGLVALGEDGWRPGCMKCCGILRKRGLLPNTEAQRAGTGPTGAQS